MRASTSSAQRRDELEQELAEARQDHFIRCVDHPGGVWAGFSGGPARQADHPDTSVRLASLQQVLRTLSTVPHDFTPHPKLTRLLATRQEMANGGHPLDWGAAEALALGTLVADGTRIRLSGQDVQRGTFSHRHAVMSDYENGQAFTPLTQLTENAELVQILNSPLSEAGVLGFEYGYSLDCPEGLVIWEAQFGDFCNAAQVIIDQFIASAEDKWERLNGLVMLLPHGFEGQGPEHSSARLERFLMLAADDNLQIVQPSTPAQMFHLLRRQSLRRWKKPLIVMTPKSLLRHPECTSTLEDLAQGRFELVLGDPDDEHPEEVRRILLCSGKVYYDLLERRDDLDRDDVALLRIEQFFPIPEAELRAALDVYPHAAEVVWIQEEPENMGAWRFLHCHFGSRLFDRLPMTVISRHASASPATGSAHSHRLEQAAILNRAFAVPSGAPA